MTDRVHVGTVDDIPDGERKLVTVDGRSIGVINFRGEYYALANECAHQAGPVCTGKLQGALAGEYVGPGELVDEYFSDVPAIACPWHGWEYDLRTGDHLGHSDISLPTYDVVIEGDDVYLEL